MNFEELIEYLKDLLFEIDSESKERTVENPGAERIDGYIFLFVPHLIGVIFGCAVSYGCKLTPEGYLVMSIVCGFTFGVIKSAVFDRMNLGRATIKNFLVVAILAVLLFMAYLLKYKN